MHKYIIHQIEIWEKRNESMHKVKVKSKVYQNSRWVFINNIHKYIFKNYKISFRLMAHI